MSVHSTHYDDPDEYERDLRWEYRGEDEQIPFYYPETEEDMEEDDNNE